ncbi:MAG: YggS family pyridoxal phosphate-dependent enzyme [Lentisphaeria bacterium]|nr:YggS family pyridoxal phosphate-dependent enzyme [Lentisphaeria bacterium]
MPQTAIASNLAVVRGQIREAAVAAGRCPDAVRLVAVSKTVDCAAVEAAHAAGQRDFGENLVQELERKAATLSVPCVWHMIGHLQRNKVRAAVRAAAWIHSVDSVALLERIDRIAAEERQTPRVLIQVRVSGEESKTGIEPEQLPALAEQARELPHLALVGLMTMAPFHASPDDLRRIFARLRLLRDETAGRLGGDLPELSMGMSGDFREAIAEGATLVRIGTAIFGPRPQPPR